MILKNVDEREMSLIKDLYEEAFPLNERKPCSVLEDNRRRGITDILSIDDEGFRGLVITAMYKDMVLIDYFAVEGDERGKGIGGEALELIRKKYNGKRVFLEIERPDESFANNGQRIRRKKFYLRNGLKDSGIAVNVYDTDMELLIFSENISFEEYEALYREAMGEEWMKKLGKPRLLQ